MTPRQNPLTRRRLLAAAAATATAGALGALARFQAPSTALRPPGALPPGAFEAACIRCFRCAEVCPPACIHLDTLFSLRESDLPSIDAATRACTLCLKCGPVCPTGALVALAAPAQVKMGTPKLNTQTCRPYNGEPCRLCYDVCPFAGAAITLDARLAPHFVDAKCVGCGLCEEACPVEDTKAIHIRPLSALSARST